MLEYVTKFRKLDDIELNVLHISKFHKSNNIT